MHGGIKITGNKFEVFGNRIISGYSIHGLVFSDNVVTTSTDYPRRDGVFGPFEIADGRDIVIGAAHESRPLSEELKR
jgi:hypothetical protein